MIHFKSPAMLGNPSELADRLAEKGLSRPAARQKAELLLKAASNPLAPASADRRGEMRAFFVPGRIEVLGKHTDYAGGSSMVAAAERGFCVVVWPREDRQVNVIDVVSGETVGFQLGPDLVPRSGHWSNYPMTVARRIARNFPRAPQGADVALASDLPPAAGMSSSSALIVAMFLALAEANDLWNHSDHQDLFEKPMELAGYLACVENGQSYGLLEGDRGVGTFGGSEDHTAILCAEAGRISQYAYCPVRFEQAIAMPSGYTFAVGVSGVVAEKTGAARGRYNRASRLVGAIMDLWRRETGRHDRSLGCVLAGPREDVARLRMFVETARLDEFDPAALSSRLEHFITENQAILPAAGDALARADLDEFGRLVDASQQAAERLLGNQIPQTAYLAAAARQKGAVAASAFGAGFGGSVWAMIEAEQETRFLAAWADAYRGSFPQNARSSSFFVTAAGPATFHI